MIKKLAAQVVDMAAQAVELKKNEAELLLKISASEQASTGARRSSAIKF